MKIVGAVVAPTTLLTSLLFFFGWSHAYWFFDYFGVSASLLGLTTQDYLLRSQDGLFVPLTVAACAALLVLWGHSVLGARLVTRVRPAVVVPAVAIAGLTLVINGLSRILVETAFNRPLAVAPLSLASGVLLLAYAVHLRRSVAPVQPDGAGRPRAEWVGVAEWAGVFVLVGLSLFWAVNDYSAAVGTSRARQFAAELPGYASAVLYSDRSLSLDAPGVRETRCQDPDATYRFRYDGLKLVLQSGDQYLFLPQAWSRTDGVAIVMPRSESLRLEFIPASARGRSQRPAC